MATKCEWTFMSDLLLWFGPEINCLCIIFGFTIFKRSSAQFIHCTIIHSIYNTYIYVVVRCVFSVTIICLHMQFILNDKYFWGCERFALSVCEHRYVSVWIYFRYSLLHKYIKAYYKCLVGWKILFCEFTTHACVCVCVGGCEYQLFTKKRLK